MNTGARRRNAVIVGVVLIIAVLLLLLVRCQPEATGVTPATAAQELSETTDARPMASEPVEPKKGEEEVLSPATIEAPREVGAGARFSVRWSGPDNERDFITIVKAGAAEGANGTYGDVRKGNPLELTAPVDAGEWELRYMTLKARAVLGRATLRVVAAEATLDAPAEAVLGSEIEVAWTGPNNAQDYVTVVRVETPEGKYGNYAETKQGSPLKLKMPPEAGAWELRYVTGQGAKTLARRAIEVTGVEIDLSAPREVVARSEVEVEWKGPNNTQDYITIVAKETKDGQYGNYRETRHGSTLQVTAPIEAGEAELRYMSGQGGRVLGRRDIRIVAAEVTLNAVGTVKAGEMVEVTWTGPNHAGDYITIVPADLPEGRYAAYAETKKGSPVKIAAPKEAGAMEIRYVAGQRSKTLARRALQVE